MIRATVVSALMALVLAGSALCQTADDVIALARKGMSEAVLLAFVETSSSSQELSGPDVVRLAEAKVPDKVIVAMLRRHPAAKPDAQAGAQQGEVARALDDQAPAGARQLAAIFTLADGRVVKAVNFVISGDDYVVKTEKGRLVTLKKSAVATVEELERKRDETQVVIAPRQPEPVVVERERIVEVPRTTVVYRDRYVPVSDTYTYATPVYQSYDDTRYSYYPRPVYVIGRSYGYSNYGRSYGYGNSRGRSSYGYHRYGNGQHHYSGQHQQSVYPRQSGHGYSNYSNRPAMTGGARGGGTHRVAF